MANAGERRVEKSSGERKARSNECNHLDLNPLLHCEANLLGSHRKNTYSRYKQDKIKVIFQPVYMQNA